MIQMDADTFGDLVEDELDLLPDDMIDGLDNVVFVVEDRPEDGSLDLLGLWAEPGLVHAAFLKRAPEGDTPAPLSVP